MVSYKFWGCNMRWYSEDVVNKILDECVSSWEVRSKLENLKDEECVTVDSFHVDEDDCIAFTFPETMGVEDIQTIDSKVRAIFPNNFVFGMISNIDVLIQNPDEAIAMLDGIKAKISIMQDTGVTEEKKIIL